MRIGICTRYGRHEATYAAIRIANGIRSMGIDVSLYTPTTNPPRIDSQWDDLVVTPDIASFTQWAKHQQHVLWTTVPHMEQLQWVKKSGKRSSIFVLWHELETIHHAIMATADQIVCPSVACYSTMTNCRLSNCVCLPWDCGQPIYKKAEDHTISNPKLFVPLWDGNARRSERTLLDMLQLTIEQHKHISVTLAYNSSTMTPGSTKQLRSMQKAAPSQLSVVKNVPPHLRFKLYQSHDLTLNASHYESTGMTQLQSIELGTPVIGFVVRPVDEIMNSGNSIGVVCCEDVRTTGFPHVIPDYMQLSDQLDSVLQNPPLLKSLQQTTPYSLQGRRELFHKSLRTIVR